MFSGGTLTFNTGTNMIDAVSARCGVPVTVENDANCALLAEAHLGCLTDCRNAVVLVIGTAVGGAIMINRAVYRGSHFHSGNASFTKVDLADEASRQLDTVNGVRTLTSSYARSVGLAAGRVDGRIFFDRLEQGDPAASRGAGHLLREPRQLHLQPPDSPRRRGGRDRRRHQRPAGVREQTPREGRRELRPRDRSCCPGPTSERASTSTTPTSWVHCSTIAPLRSSTPRTPNEGSTAFLAGRRPQEAQEASHLCPMSAPRGAAIGSETV